MNNSSLNPIMMWCLLLLLSCTCTPRVLGDIQAAALHTHGRHMTQIQTSDLVEEYDSAAVGTNDHDIGLRPAEVLPAVCQANASAEVTTDCHETCQVCHAAAALRHKRPCNCCKPGYYSAQGTAARCAKCPRGTFSAAGANRCTTCPTGTSTTAAGSSSCNGESARFGKDQPHVSMYSGAAAVAQQVVQGLEAQGDLLSTQACK